MKGWISMNKVDARNFEYLILYLPTGEYVRWTDNLDLITTNENYDVWNLCSCYKASLYYTLMDNEFILPILRQHFELIKREN